ncbi:exosome complex exonuclease RRP44 [Corythoichthys intestinalis]|uniref:exosome complex exonuclease RRP44 n=1 Tax=Corythoichthys intestinalis TaxID=161448 RepID=UPI0025A5CBEB|nr:exosome complex exonuclease RRP44 [Corythoichthys intestinalis]XP_061794288.1 exosome complex exonuclease RRP44-like [Nerophis lumbriciformis]
MLKSKTFVKKTRTGRVLKIVREHYLRDDIWCGSEACDQCSQESTVLKTDACIESSLCSFSHYLIPDTNVVLHQIDVLEDPVICNVVILQTVLQEVRHRSAPVYKRLKDLVHDSERHFYTFTNEHHRETFIEREPGESANDRNDRAIRVATKWYSEHLAKPDNPKVVLLTNDLSNKQKAQESGLLVYKFEEYIKGLTANPELLDRLALSNNDKNDISSSRVLFPEHLPLSRIQAGIKSGAYLQGTFKASRDNYLEAKVFIQKDGEEGMEVLIQGLHNLNRAVHQDVVAVQLLPRNQWVAPSSVILQDVGSAKDDANEEEEEEKMEDALRSSGRDVNRKATGKIVGIIKRSWRPFCGMLNMSQIKESTRHLFTPADRCIPRIRIETRQAATLVGQRIMVAIDGWPKDSRYPNGHFVRSLGTAGEKETEEEVLLLEHDVPHQAFSQAVLSFLPKMPWSIKPEDMVGREDLRHLTVCSVDPPGCTDIDDALHCRELSNGNFEVGVHIADVSHFIRPGNALDKEAANRGTTVYLCGKRIDMVPELLSSNLCSLRSNVERLAFSSIWEMTQEAEVLKTRFTKSVINSKASLTYAEAQMRIDDTSKSDDVTKSLRGLNRLAKILKKRRIEKGALTLSSLEVRFHMDSETHDPIELQTKELMETNSMVEEFMLLANISVAQKIYDEFTECALLRKHPAPPPSNYDILLKAAKSKDVLIRTDSAKGLADSLEAARVDGFAYFNTLLRILATRCMMQAVYFCSGMDSDFHHYGLASPIYTHFTSPIRRYADIIVHRLLAVAIGADSTYPDLTDKHKQSALCNNLNYRHKMSQYAQRASVAFHTQLFFKSRGILSEEGFVLFVRKNAIIVLIPKFGLEGTVFFDSKDKGGPNLVFDEEGPFLTVEQHTFHIFDRVKVTISLDDSNIQHQKIRMALTEPVIPGVSVSATDLETQNKKAKLDR